MRPRLRLALAVWSLLECGRTAAAQDPCPEWTPGLFYRGNGVDGDVDALTTFDDGRGPQLWVGGAFSRAADVPSSGLARWNGRSWSAPPVTTGDIADLGRISAFAVFDDGRGPALHAASGGVVRWNGSGWDLLGYGMDDYIYALQVFDDGSGPALYAGGAFSSVDYGPADGIARWDGFVWSTFSSRQLNGTVYALTVFDDGTGPALYVAGDFTTAGGTPANRIARWDGIAWTALGDGLSGGTSPAVRTLAIFDDGAGSALFAGGSFTTAGGAPTNRLARWNGSSWSSLGNGADDTVRALAAVDDGNGLALVAGGSFTTVDGVVANRIAKWNGMTWSGFGSGVNAPVATIAAFDDGHGSRVFAAGSFTAAGGRSASHIAAWDGAQWSPLGTRGTAPTAGELEVFDDGSGPVLLVSGSFAPIEAVSTSKIAKWNGSAWSPLSGRFAGYSGSPYAPFVSSMITFDSGGWHLLVAGGLFESVDAVPANSIASWNGSAWSSIGGGVAFGTSPARVNTLASFDDGTGPALFAGGDFDTAGGVAARGIAKWNGASWSAVGGGVSNPAIYAPVYALTVFDDGTGPALYVGGNFAAAGGVPANNIARWNGTSWSSLETGVQGYFPADTLVCALESFDDGNGPGLFVGGEFISSGAIRTNCIAKWNGATWVSIGSGIDGRLVCALRTFDDGSGSALYAGGDFGSISGVAARGIARWNGASWSAVGDGVQGAVGRIEGFNDGLQGSAGHAGPALYVAGRFEVAGRVVSSTLARWGPADPRRGNVNGARGPVADVLTVNGIAARDVSVEIGAPLEIRLDAAPMGPTNARYAVWVWPGASSSPVSLVRNGRSLGCLVNPSPLDAPATPQPIRCVRGTGLPSALCRGVLELRSPARAPWSLRFGRGVGAPLVVTLQGVLEDDGAVHPAGFGVTNAVVIHVE